LWSDASGEWSATESAARLSLSNHPSTIHQANINLKMWAVLCMLASTSLQLAAVDRRQHDLMVRIAWWWWW
jgi:hypothetical protein